MKRQHVIACDLGRMDYGLAWELQKRLQQRLIRAHQEDDDSLPHLFLMVEHPHVYTLGKNGNVAHLLLTEERLQAIGAQFYPIDRGGDITYHGPGQLVGYPILDLNRIFTDLHRYLRTLEEVIIRTCAHYGIEAYRVPGRTGVWTGAEGEERKICAMGIRTSRWVTMHGFAFNIHTNLDYFSYIIPCGIHDRGVTSLEKELGYPVDEDEVKAEVIRHFGELFDVDLTLMQGPRAHRFLETFAITKPTEQTT